MLSEVEIAYFRSRIDDVLHDGNPTVWQRQFLADMRGKIDRYGTKTQLSEKQLGILRRITKIERTAGGNAITMDRHRPTSRRKPWRRSTISRQWRYREIKWTAFLGVFVVLGISQLFNTSGDWSGFLDATKTASKSSFGSQRFTVTDGDTIRMADGTAVRLVGFNTPEKFQPLCAREAELGNRASERLARLVASGTSTVTRVACSCTPGTEGTDRCNFGRSCGILHVDGKDVAEMLINEGLAVSFRCGPTQCPKLPRPWCG